MLLPLLAAVFMAALTGPSASEAAEVIPEPYPFSDRYPAKVYLGSPGDLEILVGLNLDVETVRPADGSHPFPASGAPFEPLVAIVNVNPEEAGRLAERGLAAHPIPNESLWAHRLYGPGSGAPNAWPTFAQFVARMQGIADAHPDIVRMISIGKSVNNLDLWVLKITDNPDLEEDEPEFKYSSSHHGDETVASR